MAVPVSLPQHSFPNKSFYSLRPFGFFPMSFLIWSFLSPLISFNDTFQSFCSYEEEMTNPSTRRWETVRSVDYLSLLPWLVCPRLSSFCCPSPLYDGLWICLSLISKRRVPRKLLSLNHAIHPLLPHATSIQPFFSLHN